MSIVKGITLRNDSKATGRALNDPQDHGGDLSADALDSNNWNPCAAAETSRSWVEERLAELSSEPHEQGEMQMREFPPILHRARTRSWQMPSGDIGCERGVESEQSRDRKAADELVKLVQQLNRAMDEAKRNGLIVEPSLSTTKTQFGGDGSSGHLLSIKVFRKLC